MRRRQSSALAILATSAIVIAALPVLGQSKPPEKSSKEKAIVQAMEENKVTLSRAIEVAEATSQGKAIGARAALDRDKLSFTVQCVVEDKLEVVRIDGKTGKPIAPSGRKDAPKDGKDDPKGDKKPKPPEPPTQP
jgi:hypothetical protein